MNKFGALNGVTASSLLLLGNQSLDFLKSCNKSLDELNMISMADELSYMSRIKSNIENILNSKPEFKINSSTSKEEKLNNLLSSLNMIIKNRTNLESDLGLKTNLFSGEDVFGDIFDSDEESEESFGDIFGDESFESSEAKEIMVDSITVNNLLDFRNSSEFIQNSLDISDIDTNNLLDELSVINEFWSVFDARCKMDPNTPINESIGIKKIVSSRRGNPIVIDYIEKSYNRISLFHLNFNELKELVEEINEMKLISVNEDVKIENLNYSDRIVAIGDNIAYLIYSNMGKLSYSSNDTDLISKLIAFCSVKSNKITSKTTILGIPLNMCYLKFKGNNYKTFCENLELSLLQIPNRTPETYFMVVKNIMDSIRILLNYIESVTFDSREDIDFETFKGYVRYFIFEGNKPENYHNSMKDFMIELSNKNLIPPKKFFIQEPEKVNETIHDYVLDIYDTYKLYRMSDKFGLNYINELLPQEVISNYGVVDINDLIELNKYLRDVYKIIPLTVSNLVKSKIMATSKTNRVVNKQIYNDIKPLVRLLLENFESKFSEKQRDNYMPSLIIS